MARIFENPNSFKGVPGNSTKSSLCIKAATCECVSKGHYGRYAEVAVIMVQEARAYLEQNTQCQSREDCFCRQNAGVRELGRLTQGFQKVTEGTYC